MYPEHKLTNLIADLENYASQIMAELICAGMSDEFRTTVEKSDPGFSGYPTLLLEGTGDHSAILSNGEEGLEAALMYKDEVYYAVLSALPFATIRDLTCSWFLTGALPDHDRSMVLWMDNSPDPRDTVTVADNTKVVPPSVWTGNTGLDNILGDLMNKIARFEMAEVTRIQAQHKNDEWHRSREYRKLDEQSERRRKIIREFTDLINEFAD